jgi:hypothetical protein
MVWYLVKHRDNFTFLPLPCLVKSTNSNETGVLLYVLLFADIQQLSVSQNRNLTKCGTTPGVSTSHLGAPNTRSISRLCTRQW